jgi:hypothetical protein
MTDKTKQQHIMNHDQKKKGQQPGFQKIRLDRYYHQPPYGTRYWILAPFIDEGNTELKEKIRADFGVLDPIRPMHKDDVF